MVELQNTNVFRYISKLSFGVYNSYTMMTVNILHGYQTRK